jgi:hypothetical protein
MGDNHTHSWNLWEHWTIGNIFQLGIFSCLSPKQNPIFTHPLPCALSEYIQLSVSDSIPIVLIPIYHCYGMCPHLWCKRLKQIEIRQHGWTSLNHSVLKPYNSSFSSSSSSVSSEALVRLRSAWNWNHTMDNTNIVYKKCGDMCG